MASIRKVGKKWLAEVRIKGFYKSKRHNTKAEAQGWALNFEHQIGVKGILHGRTVGDAFRRYMEEVSPTKKGVRWEVIRLKKLANDNIAHITLTELTTDDVQSWIHRQTISGSSVNRELTLISAVFSKCRRWKWMSQNVMQDLERPKKNPSRDRILFPHEIDRLLFALGYQEDQPIVSTRQKLAVAMLFAIETAMRQGEIWTLRWEYVNLEQCYVSLLDTKNGTSRDVPLSTRAVELLRKLEPEQTGKVFKSNQQSSATMFRRAVKLAEIEDLHFHDTRHTAITHLAKKLPVLDLARMVGHKDLRSLQVYYNPTAADMAKMLD